MGAFSDYFENWIINHMLRAAEWTPPVAVYLALFTAVTGLEADAPSAECETPGVGGYSRQACALDAATTGISANTADETFTVASSDWGTITHWCLCDHATNVTWGTNVHVLMWGEVTTPKHVDIGDTAKVTAGELDISVD